MIAALVLVGAVAGGALEVAHPAFFRSEPVVLWTPGAEPTPLLFFCGQPWPVRWTVEAEGERVRWEALLPPEAPLGAWVVCVGAECFAFLRVEDGASLVEVVGAPPGAHVAIDGGPPHTLGERGSGFFLTRPGRHALEAWHACDRLVQVWEIAPGERKTVRLGDFVGLGASSPEVLPGRRFRLILRVRSALALPRLEIQAVLPPGWRAVGEEELFRPVPAGGLVERRLEVEVPPEAAEGVYRILVRWHGQERGLAMRVVSALSPLRVVGHWDVARGDLDLTAPFALTFERVLWAASLLGQPLPYTGVRLTPELLREILEAWASGAGG
ncbi:MAG: NEW3 domain-containing protein [Candidatus Bipolaricaulota bacterium]|nr:NEW3 domain-containing protein [Candidatus Bipolaricaulota bacterium]MCX7844207.1 NEW3 domain-containing protein [Candidatus Bipolaricaulota bacterium]MDW8152024.1 NEW3 domain-containing protein [Candidatus Bipolaricaulota bacterium]